MNRNVKVALLLIAIIVVVLIVAGQMRQAYSLGQKAGRKAGTAPAVMMAPADRVVIE